MFDMTWRKEAWFDVVNLALAIFLFLSPWMYRFASNLPVARDAWICGIVIGLASIWAIVSYSEWEEWVNVVFGLWLLISPWILGFHNTVLPAMRVDVSVGIVIVLIAVTDMWMTRQAPPRLHA
jgi:SPW repeat